MPIPPPILSSLQTRQMRNNVRNGVRDTGFDEALDMMNDVMTSGLERGVARFQDVSSAFHIDKEDHKGIGPHLQMDVGPALGGRKPWSERLGLNQWEDYTPDLEPAPHPLFVPKKKTLLEELKSSEIMRSENSSWKHIPLLPGDVGYGCPTGGSKPLIDLRIPTIENPARIVKLHDGPKVLPGVPEYLTAFETQKRAAPSLFTEVKHIPLQPRDVGYGCPTGPSTLGSGCIAPRPPHSHLAWVFLPHLGLYCLRILIMPFFSISFIISIEVSYWRATINLGLGIIFS